MVLFFAGVVVGLLLHFSWALWSIMRIPCPSCGCRNIEVVRKCANCKIAYDEHNALRLSR